MILPKDIYEYLTNFVDNKTIVNMFSVNKRFNSEEFYHRALRKYPLLLRLKKDETYKRFFVQMGYYIDLLQKDGIPYFPLKEYDPKYFFRYYYHTSTKYDRASYYASILGYTKEVLSFQDKCFEKFNTAMLGAARGGHLNLVQLLIDKGADYFNRPLMEAATYGNLDIVKLLYPKAPWARQEAVLSASKQGHVDIVKFFLDKDIELYDVLMEDKFSSKKENIIELLKQYK